MDPPVGIPNLYYLDNFILWPKIFLTYKYALVNTVTRGLI